MLMVGLFFKAVLYRKINVIIPEKTKQKKTGANIKCIVKQKNSTNIVISRKLPYSIVFESIGQNSKAFHNICELKMVC